MLVIHIRKWFISSRQIRVGVFVYLLHIHSCVYFFVVVFHPGHIPTQHEHCVYMNICINNMRTERILHQCSTWCMRYAIVCVCCVCVHVWPFTVIQSQKNKLKWAIIECIHFCARAVWTNGNVNSVLKPMRDAHHIRCLQSKLGQQQYFVQCESCLLIIWPRWQTPLTTTKTRYEHLHFVLCTFNLVPRCEDYASEKKRSKFINKLLQWMAW